MSPPAEERSSERGLEISAPAPAAQVANPIVRSIANSDSSDRSVHSCGRAWDPPQIHVIHPVSVSHGSSLSLSDFHSPSLSSLVLVGAESRSPARCSVLQLAETRTGGTCFFIYFVLQWKCYIHNLCSHLIIFLLLHELYTQIFY